VCSIRAFPLRSTLTILPSSRSIIIGGRNTYTGKGYVQYEIIGGGAGARPTKDGMSGTSVNQSNAKIAPVEILESEFPTRILRFELIRDSGGAGRFRGGLGIRREYLNLADARFSIRSTKHVVPPNGFAGGRPGRTGDILINPDRDGAKRLPTRYADYPLKADDVFRLDSPGGGGFGDPLSREPLRVLDDVREGTVSREAAEKEYGVVLKRIDAEWTIDEAKTAARRTACSLALQGGSERPSRGQR
jgi:N-methylhydantoinase B